MEKVSRFDRISRRGGTCPSGGFNRVRGGFTCHRGGSLATGEVHSKACGVDPHNDSLPIIIQQRRQALGLVHP